MWIALQNLNWLVVFCAGLATFILGALWYTALFGKVWLKLHGWSEEKVKEMQAKTPPALFLGGMLLAYVVIAIAVALVVAGLDVKTIFDGLMVGLVLAAIAAAIGFTDHLASDKVIGIFFINSGFQTLFLLAQGALLALWR